MLGLLAAIRGFQSGKETSFRTYAEICVRSRLYAAVRAAQITVDFSVTPKKVGTNPAFKAESLLLPGGFRRIFGHIFAPRASICKKVFTLAPFWRIIYMKRCAGVRYVRHRSDYADASVL